MDPTTEAIDAAVSALEAAGSSGCGLMSELERRLRTGGLGDDPAYWIAFWSDRAERHRNTTFRLARVCRWLRRHPSTPAIRDHETGCDFTLAQARQELRFQVEQHVRARTQARFWAGEQSRDLAAGMPDLPAPANDPTPNSRSDAA